jgi:hypothetical protein
VVLPPDAQASGNKASGEPDETMLALCSRLVYEAHIARALMLWH